MAHPTVWLASLWLKVCCQHAKTQTHELTQSTWGSKKDSVPLWMTSLFPAGPYSCSTMLLHNVKLFCQPFGIHLCHGEHWAGWVTEHLVTERLMQLCLFPLSFFLQMRLLRKPSSQRWAKICPCDHLLPEASVNFSLCSSTSISASSGFSKMKRKHNCLISGY